MKYIFKILCFLFITSAYADTQCLNTINHELRQRGLGNSINAPSGNLSIVNRNRANLSNQVMTIRTRILNRREAELGPEKFHPYDWQKWEDAGLVAPSENADILTALDEYQAYQTKVANFEESSWHKTQKQQVSNIQEILDNELDEIWLENNRIQFDSFKLIETQTGKVAKIFYNGEDLVGASFYDPDNKGKKDIYTFDGDCGAIKNYRSIKKYSQGLSSESYIVNKDTCETILKPELREQAQSFNNQIDSYHQVCSVAGGTSEGQFPSWMTTIVLTRKCQCTNVNGGKFLISPFEKSCSKETRPVFNDYELVQNEIRKTLPTKFWWYDYGKEHYNDMFVTCQRISEYMQEPDDLNSPCTSCRIGVDNTGGGSSIGVR